MSEREATHTPGPWEVSSLEGREWIIASPGMGLGVAWAPAEPDAHLIAAAPDLLEAAEDLAVWLRSTVGVPTKLAAAIAKAHGQDVAPWRSSPEAHS